MYKARRTLLVLIVVLTPVALLAQGTTGSLSGIVTSQGAPVPGVTVTASSPSMQGTRTAVTGDAGGFYFPNLPPGNYVLTYDLAGMQKVDKRVTINVAQMSKADVEMKVSAATESITVSAAAPAVAEATEVSANFNSKQINELPTGRTIDDVTRLAPGVNEAGPNNQIVISGANSYDNLFLVDGVVVNENLRGQPNPLYVEDAIQETTVMSGAISAEFGRFTGGVVSTITKSGGNDFSGSLRDSLSDPNWTEKSDYAQQTDPIDQINNSYEGTLGGRIVRDRLWFFLAGRYNNADSSKQTALTNVPYVFTSNDKRYEVKLTGQINPKNSLVGSYISSKEHRDNNVSGGTVVDLRSLAPYDRPKNLLSLNYSGVATSNLLLEAQYSRMNDKFTNGATDRDLINGTILIDDDDSVRGWSPTFCGSPCPAKQRNNKGWLGKGSYFLSTKATGNHSIVGGLEEFRQLRNENNFQSGSDFRIHGDWYFVGDQLVFGTDPDVGYIEWDPVPSLSQTSNFGTRSVFVNDKWDLNTHLNFNLGARYDKADGKDQAGHKTVDDSAFSPRLGVAYDLGGNGRHRFSATYGRYVSKVDQGPADNTATAGRYASYYWVYGGPSYNMPGTPASQLLTYPQLIQNVFNWFQSVGGTANRDFLDSAFIPGTTTRFDKSLTAPHMDETSVGYSMAFGSRGFVRADAMYRKWADFYVVRRTLETGKATDPNGDQFDQGVIENSSDGLSRNYRGVQLQANYGVLRNLTIGGNYTWSKLRGNVEGELPSFATTFTDFNNRPEYTGFTQYNPVGYLGPDMRHRANAWVQYDLETGLGRLNFSLLERYHSALSYSASGTIDVRKGTANGPADGVVNPGYETPPSNVTYYFSDRGAFRVDPISSTDLGLNWYLPSFSGARGFIEVDLLNVLGQQGIEDPDFINQTVLTRRQTACLQTGTNTRCVAFNPFTTTPQQGVNWQYGPTFGKPISSSAYQQPRTYRFSVGVKF
jgi:hypothetical protein